MGGRIIKTGNSVGIHLSMTILEKYHSKDEVELILGEGRIIFKPKSVPRQGWESKSKIMRENGDDVLLIPKTLSSHKFTSINL